MTESCPLCKSARTGVKYPLTGYRIALCFNCGFEFHDGFQGGGGDDDMFSESYYRVQHRDAFEAQFDDYTRDPSVAVYRNWLERIEELVEVGRILDVGSALGTFLKIAEARGWDPQGVEISRFAAQFARNRRGLSVFNGDLHDFSEQPGAFDAVTFWDSIEHVANPRQNLEKAVRLLRPGGVMLLTTDNFDCLVGDLARWAYRLSFGVFRYPMQRVFIDRNRSFFTLKSLRGLLENCGLEIVMLEKMEYPLQKIRANWLERLILHGLYGAAAILRRQAQVTVVAQKPSA